MSKFDTYRDVVYIFDNPKSQRVKIGFTTNNHDIVSRLNDVNDIWLERKVKCQICGTRIMSFGFTIPTHRISGQDCPGGNQLPLERSITLAQTYLKDLKEQISELSGSKKGSIARKIKTLKKRISLYQDYQSKTGQWHFYAAYITDRAKDVESLSHKILEDFLDTTAPLGEIFNCSPSVATNTIEKALESLELLHSVKKIFEL